ncbi:putative methylated DNA-protein cysteine methyltransferase [Beggiatoa alba B18LD]|uniref:Putative methylated DNA-protein cysteine methyltransferase n=1 Tax=Beggiatoa alba B18LD TaxID=395493 RepID=I3CC72_9GAMM|nr:MGMT family protein [Beggiatoa alba]EIJ41215.1 putative methylated DNA-protein cysteine methyltransferase [Beggiatoa alba B18LD]
MSSSSLYSHIWSIVQQIPVGNVASYGQIARLAGLPRQARLVGYALHHLPPDSDVPWFRVLNAQGKISFPLDSDLYLWQKQLLEAEGVIFWQGKVDLQQFGWQVTTLAINPFEA